MIVDARGSISETMVVFAVVTNRKMVKKTMMMMTMKGDQKIRLEALGWRIGGCKHMKMITK